MQSTVYATQSGVRPLPLAEFLVVLALIVGAVVMASCTAWQRSHAAGEDARILDATMDRSAWTANQLKLGGVVGTWPREGELQERPTPLPARSPVSSAIIAGLAILFVGRIYVFMRRVEIRPPARRHP